MPTDRHADDGFLLAIHDGERSPDLAQVQHHVQQCSDCQTRLAAIAADAAIVRESLASVVSAPVGVAEFRRRLDARPVPLLRRPAIRAAAAAIVLAAVAAASPVRGWLRDRITRSSTVAAPSTPPAPAVTAPDRAGSTVTFVATEPTFVVQFDSVPAAGVLVIERTSASEISARVSSGAAIGGDAMVVLPSALRWRNGAASRASYVLSVPSSIVRVRVVVAGRTTFDGTPPVEVRLTR